MKNSLTASQVLSFWNRVRARQLLLLTQVLFSATLNVPDLPKTEQNTRPHRYKKSTKHGS
jgi:hypothetical protein